MRTRAVWMAAVAGLLLVGCTEEGEPEVADTAAEPTAEVTAPDDVTATDTGEPTVTLDTASPTDTGADAGAATTDDAAGAPATECETAVSQAGGLPDVRNLDAAARDIFDACPSVEEFTTAVESQLEGFEDVDLDPYVRTACTFAQDLTGTPLCQSI